MGILNKIGEAASSASRNVNEKTKNMSDTSNLKRKILYEEERIVEIFTEVQEKFQFCGVCGAKLPSGDEDFD